MDKFVYFWIPTYNDFECELKINKISKNIEEQNQVLKKIDNSIKNINKNVNYNKLEINKILHNTQAISQKNLSLKKTNDK